MEKRVEWTLGDGLKATYTVGLRLSKVVDLDGDKMTAPCCDIIDSLDIPGQGYISASITKLDKVISKSGKTIVAVIGQKVGIEQGVYDEIKAAIAEVKAAPEYAAKIETGKRNEAEWAKIEQERRRNGYCTKCHSYCYGDCEAN